MTEGEQYRILLDRNYYKVLNGTKEFKRVEMKNGTEIFYGEENEIIFTYLGAPVHGGTTITINNEKLNKYYKITIVPASGRILLLEE